MLFYTEKEAKLVAESRESANIIVIFKKKFTATSFFVIKGNVHTTFLKLSHA